ncbi:MAG TPA: monovalent cation:proton antiporter-2 (CPA2) family protein [Oligoflexus sp.]|uniref:monovalent cation:proton antiporter-2 (CPA2) family protein n=1 Tax=Oligoflexus sp. TaxID=1971216 RepID=UPI002D566E91|nr:monovalent cation:proton antiporter-2 (CPA2) family protein [Oligoflexus sp.]HYX34318.1 monovalent cation:proton antiporter-2 (CPA2) family protein [Oligoflexus sp.]
MTDSTLLFMVILFGVALLAVPVTARLGLGSVIGYLIAGVLVGPEVFGWVTNPEKILHLAEFGVVLLLFLIGLELNPKRLWKLRRSIFGLGSAQLLLTIVLMAGAFHFLQWTWKEAWIAGMGIAMSSTAIAMQIMRERGLQHHPVGQNGFSILLFQDIAVVPVLLLASLLKPTDGSSLWESLSFVDALTAVGSIVGIIIAGRYLTRPVFRWIAGARIHELSIAFSLLIVVGISWVMVKVGLSMALGAFLAGVILAESEYRHELEANIEPFKGLLLGLFFLAVGMSIKLQLLADQPLLIAGLVVGLVLVKTLVITVVSWVSGVKTRDKLLLGLLLSQGGEFAFVLYSQAIQDGVLTPERADLLNGVISLSMLTTPLLLLIYDRWAAKACIEGSKKPAPDAMPEEKHSIIIAGFGRMGQIVARLLHVNHISTTIIDHSPEHIDNMRRFGYKAYYGDASQLNLLEAAGLAEAKMLVIAMDDRETVTRVAAMVRREYPNIPILVRAYDRTHAFELMDHGIEHFERETFGSALLIGCKALEIMGVHPYQAWRTTTQFRLYDAAALQRLYPYRADEKQFISKTREAREQLEKLFVQDEEKLKSEDELEGWA